MGCMKCGRETISEQVFCPECLAEMEKYPVRPGTVVQLPSRKAPAPLKKPSKKKILAPEEQVKVLKKRTRILTALLLAVILLAAALAVPAAERWQETHRKKGQNYTTIVATEPN